MSGGGRFPTVFRLWRIACVALFALVLRAAAQTPPSSAGFELSETGTGASRSCALVVAPSLTLGDDKAPRLRFVTEGQDHFSVGLQHDEVYAEAVLVRNNQRKPLVQKEYRRADSFLASDLWEAIRSGRPFFVTARLGVGGNYVSSRYDPFDFDAMLRSVQAKCPFDAEVLMLDLTPLKEAEQALRVAPSELVAIRRVLHSEFAGDNNSLAETATLQPEERGYLKKYAARHGLPVSGFLTSKAVGMLLSDAAKLPPPADQLTNSDLCTKAMNADRDGWDEAANAGSFVSEAKSRGLTLDGCRSAMGLPTLAEEELRRHPTVRFTIANNTSSRIGVAFFDRSSHLRFFPASDRYYPQDGHQTQTYSMACTPGKYVCYGAWKGDGGLNPFWGVGVRGKESCDHCCVSCPTAEAQSYSLNQNDSRRPKPTLTWTVNDKTRDNLVVAFYSETRRRHGWPAWSRNWSLHKGENTFTLNCRAGEKICYGAWNNSRINGSYWGVGPWKKHGCRNCCFTCNGGTAYTTLVP